MVRCSACHGNDWCVLTGRARNLLVTTGDVVVLHCTFSYLIIFKESVRL
jgi:hypothetical protein